MKYYEDMPLGVSNESEESYTFSAQEIKAFAHKWDPMPFHTDEELAAGTPIGALFASSIHTVAVGVKLSHSFMDDEVAAVAGLGWDDVRFFKPVFAGDVVRIKSEVTERRESKSKPDRGIITTRISVINQDSETVAEYKITTLVLKNPGGS
ncbi:MAG: MaoC family dehydratase N-terminal domain-containing protein [Deltaproteobacteria bacterium]|nr:MaoC family dehydratase N-terminal domain-containing protein [Deltaproteobacteria bacterium]MBW2399844.1 MaoC family dehydratase N-terminal domain-containing protein [Deltaproteobacteria bacterium]